MRVTNPIMEIDMPDIDIIRVNDIVLYGVYNYVCDARSACFKIRGFGTLGNYFLYL